MKVSPDNQTAVSSEEDVPKSFEYVQPSESKKSFNIYNLYVQYNSNLQEKTHMHVRRFFGWASGPIHTIFLYCRSR